jgi:hypothetical protein
MYIFQLAKWRALNCGFRIFDCGFTIINPHSAIHNFGEVTEWSKVHAWKACVQQCTRGSNPRLSAIDKGDIPVFKREIPFFVAFHIKSLSYAGQKLPLIICFANP